MAIPKGLSITLSNGFGEKMKATQIQKLIDKNERLTAFCGVQIGPTALEKLKEYSRKNGLTVSSQIRSLIIRELDKNGY